jgi:hypothetical protein
VGNATADIRQNAKLSSCLSATGRRGSWPTPPNPHLAKKGVRLTPYEVGYYKRWRKEGFKDGEQGLFRSSKFENKDYDWGWIEAMEKKHKQGFQHERHEEDFSRLVRRYVSEDNWWRYGVRKA